MYGILFAPVVTYAAMLKTDAEVHVGSQSLLREEEDAHEMADAPRGLFNRMGETISDWWEDSSNYRFAYGTVRAHVKDVFKGIVGQAYIDARKKGVWSFRDVFPQEKYVVKGDMKGDWDVDSWYNQLFDYGYYTDHPDPNTKCWDDGVTGLRCPLYPDSVLQAMLKDQFFFTADPKTEYFFKNSNMRAALCAAPQHRDAKFETPFC
jgi:hypothetical protein